MFFSFSSLVFCDEPWAFATEYQMWATGRWPFVFAVTHVALGLGIRDYLLVSSMKQPVDVPYIHGQLRQMLL